MNWGMVPFQMKEAPDMFDIGSYIYVPGIKKALAENSTESIKAYVIGDTVKEITLYTTPMTEDERKIVQAGCLINYNREKKGL